MGEIAKRRDTRPQLTMFGQPCIDKGSRFMVGEHYWFTFDNGWGASVIRGEISFGSWELAVVGKDGHLNYDHPVSQGDVVRGDEAEIAEMLALIKATPPDTVYHQLVEILEGPVVE